MATASGAPSSALARVTEATVEACPTVGGGRCGGDGGPGGFRGGAIGGGNGRDGLDFGAGYVEDRGGLITLWDITVEGWDVPKLIRFFQEATFPGMYC